MSRRPRLVEEGSPISYDDDSYDRNRKKHKTASILTKSSSSARKRENTSLVAASAAWSSGRKKRYVGGGAGGVRTRLVIGGNDETEPDSNDYGKDDHHSNNFTNDNHPLKQKQQLKQKFEHSQTEQPQTTNPPSSSHFTVDATYTAAALPHHTATLPFQHNTLNTTAIGAATTSPPPPITTTTYFPSSPNLSYENDIDMEGENKQNDHQRHHYQNNSHHFNNIQQQKQSTRDQQQQHYHEQHPTANIGNYGFHSVNHTESTYLPSHQQQSQFRANNQADPLQQQHQLYEYQQQQQQPIHTSEEQQHNYQFSSFPLSSIPPPPQPQQQSSFKSPLIVIDGANVAHIYADAASSTKTKEHTKKPNVQGIQIVVDYFKEFNCRVIVVLPATWMRSKPSEHDLNRGECFYCGEMNAYGNIGGDDLHVSF
uniref:RNase NYN domain-containing protein n=1 Tax=Ditylum brightwellii TaxID=49249 RepID=A0A7S4R4I2_9STRA